MSEFTQFRTVEKNNGTTVCVEVRGWFGWRSGYMGTDYFSISYPSIPEANNAIRHYKQRIQEVP